jgi:hypothetical protein
MTLGASPPQTINKPLHGKVTENSMQDKASHPLFCSGMTVQNDTLQFFFP